MRTRFEKPDARFDLGGGTIFVSKTDTDEEMVLNVDGVVGDGWEGLSSNQIVPTIQSTKKPIRLKLNTPGGLVTDALTINNALFDHPEKVTADIVASAWSAGTILCAACDLVRIAPAAKYGLHRAWSGAFLVGNAEELEVQLKGVTEYLNTLRDLDDAIAEMIAIRTENSKDDVMEWMVGPEGSDGTEFVGQKAVDAGLADEIIPIPSKPTKNSQHLKAAARSRYFDVLSRIS